MNDNEHNITDVVYFMFNNRPAKGVITQKCRQRVSMIDIHDRVTHKSFTNNPSRIFSLIQEEYNTLYQIYVIPAEEDNIQYQPINGWFADDYIYDSKEELLAALAKMPV